MKTVGEILKKARLEKKLTHEEIEKAIKIRKKFLIALEENAWGKLPSLPYIKGFIKNYSSYLGLHPHEMVAIFRREFKDSQKMGLLPKSISDEPRFHLTPQLGVVSLVVFFLLLFFGYLFFQYQSLTNPPYLNIEKPNEGEVITTQKVAIAGTTDADAVISINNQKIAVSEKGKFDTSITLTPGINTIMIESVSKYGKKRTIVRTVQIENLDQEK